jgi:hypothetical protein
VCLYCGSHWGPPLVSGLSLKVFELAKVPYAWFLSQSKQKLVHRVREDEPGLERWMFTYRMVKGRRLSEEGRLCEHQSNTCDTADILTGATLVKKVWNEVVWIHDCDGQTKTQAFSLKPPNLFSRRTEFKETWKQIPSHQRKCWFRNLLRHKCVTQGL